MIKNQNETQESAKLTLHSQNNTTLIQGWIKDSAPQTLIQRLFHLSPHTRLGSQVRGGERQVSGQQRAALEEEGSAARAARVAPPAADLTLQDGGRGQPLTRAQPASPPPPSPTTGSAGSAAGASEWSGSRMLLSHIRLRSSMDRNTPGLSVLHCFLAFAHPVMLSSRLIL